MRSVMRQRWRSHAMIEGLEDRRLMSATIHPLPGSTPFEVKGVWAFGKSVVAAGSVDASTIRVQCWGNGVLAWYKTFQAQAAGSVEVAGGQSVHNLADTELSIGSNSASQGFVQRFSYDLTSPTLVTSPDVTSIDGVFLTYEGTGGLSGSSVGYVLWQ